MTTVERNQHLEILADVLSRVWYYGNWKAETPAEGQLEQLLTWLGYWPTTEDEIIKRPRV